MKIAVISIALNEKGFIARWAKSAKNSTTHISSLFANGRIVV